MKEAGGLHNARHRVAAERKQDFPSICLNFHVMFSSSWVRLVQETCGHLWGGGTVGKMPSGSQEHPSLLQWVLQSGTRVVTKPASHPPCSSNLDVKRRQLA